MKTNIAKEIANILDKAFTILHLFMLHKLISTLQIKYDIYHLYILDVCESLFLNRAAEDLMKLYKVLEVAQWQKTN